MKKISVLAIAMLLCSLMIACKKKSSLTPREQQQQDENTQVLLPNEILEKEGIRFVLSYPEADAQIHLKLVRVNGTTHSPISLSPDHLYFNYYVLTNQLDENTEFTLIAEFTTVTKAGTFDLTVTGFTNLNTTKSFTLPGNSFIVANAGTSKNILKIKKGLNKYSFFSFH
jgi:hypothetical protein